MKTTDIDLNEISDYFNLECLKIADLISMLLLRTYHLDKFLNHFYTPINISYSILLSFILYILDHFVYILFV